MGQIKACQPKECAGGVKKYMVMNCQGSEGGQGESKRVSLGMQGRETILERGVSEVKQETLTDSEGPAVESITQIKNQKN